MERSIKFPTPNAMEILTDNEIPAEYFKAVSILVQSHWNGYTSVFSKVHLHNLAKDQFRTHTETKGWVDAAIYVMETNGWCVEQNEKHYVCSRKKI